MQSASRQTDGAGAATGRRSVRKGAEGRGADEEETEGIAADAVGRGVGAGREGES